MTKASLSWRVSRKEAGTRLLQFLREHCPEAPSVKALKRAIDTKLCRVNRRIETFSSFVLKENDIIDLDPAAFVEKDTSFKIPILFEDPFFLIVNKPAGLVSETRALRHCFPKQTEPLELVHRLDKETTGVLILAKSKQIKEKMISLFQAHAVQKTYLALVDGIVAKEEGTIDNYLGKKRSYQGQTIYGSVSKEKGLHAVTHWKCLKKGQGVSLLACQPKTGRTHQLRVHLSEIGHPILGDTQYGKHFRSYFTPSRNLLHAYRVVFTHPMTGKEVNVIAPIPKDFKACLDDASH